VYRKPPRNPLPKPLILQGRKIRSEVFEKL